MGNYESDQKNARFFGLKLSRNTDREIIEHLEQQSSIQGYLKNLILKDMSKGGNTMKRYIIKPEYLNLYGEDASPMTVLTEDDVKNLASEWEMDETELLDQLIEIRETAWRPVHRFAGKPGWQELNELIRQDSGCEEDYCETEQAYQQAVREGFINFDGYYTTIYVDD